MQRLANRLALAFMMALTVSHTNAEVVERALKVTYVSADLVYLNGGRAEGLFVGAKPTVLCDGQTIIELEVLHLAEHSSACRFAGPPAGVKVGDSAKITIEVKAPITGSDAESIVQPVPFKAEQKRRDVSQSNTKSVRHRPHASGSIAILYSNWDDYGDADLDFAQGRINIDLRVEPLWMSGLTFALRTSGRQDRRTSPMDGTGDDSWESRIATFALEYKPDGSRLGMSMGRINPARVGAIGRLDGGSFEYRISEPVRFGLFAGANSHWQYAENRPELQTYGVYAGYRRGSTRALLVDQTIAMVGQYHGHVASREALLVQGRITRNDAWSISHSAEIEVNRGWRQEDGDPVFDVSTIFAQGRAKLSREISASLSYDTRKSFRTYETRDIADSIFDDRVRQGIRSQLDVVLPQGISLTAGAGVRSLTNESDKTISINGSIRKQGLMNAKSNATVQWARFESDATSGYNLNVSLGQGMRRSDWLGLGAGLYSYKLADDSVARLNRRVDLTARVSLTQTLSLNAMGQLNGGDDTRGHRLEAGLNLHF